MKQRIVFIIGVFALFVVIIGASGGNINPPAKDDDYYSSGANNSSYNKNSTNSGSKYSPNREKDAWVCAQDIVNSNLKAPATAKFCSYTEATITHNGGSDYTVKGYVDAENSYGVQIRTNFTVTLTLTEKGYTNGYVTFS